MNETISFTLYELYTFLMAMCGVIITMSAAVAVIIRVIQKVKQPEVSQNKRIDELEKEAEKFKQLFDNDNKRLIELEKGNRIMQQSMLALLSHALNGNDVDSLKKAKDNLQNYLIDKEGIR